jgi:hypothetical protein
MASLDQDYARVLTGIDPLTGELAKSLLAEAGIPSLLSGPDLIAAECGELMRNSKRTFAVFVPRSARALARQVLDGAFGQELPADTSCGE